MKLATTLMALAVALMVLSCSSPRATRTTGFHQSAKTVDPYEFVEVALKLDKPLDGNPFTDATFSGEFAADGEAPLKVAGFCDAQDGSIFRVRFMPTKPGNFRYTATFEHKGARFSQSDTFAARSATRAGIVRVDRANPFHFLQEGNGEHFFWNSTTTYQLLAWDDDTIRQSLHRLARLGVNRIRVGLEFRTKGGQRWGEPLVQPTQNFKFRVEPWLAERPENFENPGFDVKRFNVAHWQKMDRTLLLARQLGIQVSLIFYVDGRDKGVDPFGKQGMGGEDEQRYYRYVIARAAAFPNVMWDVANEYRLFRDDAWANQMGALIKKHDPYAHLTSTHGHETFSFRASPWADFAMYQRWDEHGGYAFMLRNREEQKKTGRVIPQVNEEYGYEDHYPTGWGENRRPPARNADSRRRIAWQVTMAGCYQTTGERADGGTGAGPDTGGGWINGRGDETMVLLKAHGPLVRFFTSLPWWTLEPRPDLVATNAMCLAAINSSQPAWVVYLPNGGSTSITTGKTQLSARLFNPRTGEAIDYGTQTRGNIAQWETPETPDRNDWVWLIQ